MKNFTLHQLSLIEDKLRNITWENYFFNQLTLSDLKVTNLDPQYGPDGWPYLFAETVDREGTESFQKVLNWLVQRGIGLVINANKKMPDYIFTYGMLWHFKETGLFYLNNIEVSKTMAEAEYLDFSNKELLMHGCPTEAYLPLYVRKIIKEFFQQQGIIAPRILMISREPNKFDLVFSLESLGSPPQKEHQGICEAISWFLPPHYSIMISSEKALPRFYTLD